MSEHSTPITDGGQARGIADAVARRSYGKLVALLAARTGDLAAAEDALSEAFLSALETWRVNGFVQDTEINITFSRLGSFSVAQFTGLTFTDISGNPGITGATLASTNIRGCGDSQVTFTRNSVSLNFAFLDVFPRQ